MKKDKVLSMINPLFFNGVAHRGLHSETITENSPSAFKNALEHNISLELDVHLSKDNELFVCHDASLKRTTGKEGIIEDLTSKEIKEQYQLLNGERIPTLKEVLSLIDEKVGMVIEIKPDPKKKNYRQIAERVEEELRNIKDTRNFILISFYPQPLLYLKHLNIVRCLLVGKDNPSTYVLRNFFEGVDLDIELLKEEKYQKSISKRLTMSWTIDDQEKAKLALAVSDILTFQFLPLNTVKKGA